ncbi:MAG: hypothetical protein PHD95_00695 [Candidatus ainarchaeum sp.]|nr:hypothetical protein [Candidatus ainarchaeum sp.]
MQVTDVFLGIVLLGLLAWTMVIALNQNNMAVVLNNLSSRQQAIISDTKYCRSMQGLELVKQENLGFNEYTIVPAVSEAKQLVLCVYKPLQE